MPVRRIDGNDVDLCLDERSDAFHRVGRRTHRRAGKQSAVFIACGIRVLNALFDIFDRDQAFEETLSVDNGQFLDSVLAEDLLRVLERGSDGRGNKIILRHHVADRLFVVGFETQIAVGENADEFAVFRDRHAADTVAFHERHGVADEVVGFEIERIGNNAVFRPFYLIDLFGLLFDRHIFMDNAHAALSRHGDRKTAFGNGIHRRGNDGNIQKNTVRQFRSEIDVGRQHFRCLRNQQYVVERKPLFHDFTHF